MTGPGGLLFSLALAAPPILTLTLVALYVVRVLDRDSDPLFDE